MSFFIKDILGESLNEKESTTSTQQSLCAIRPSADSISDVSTIRFENSKASNSQNGDEGQGQAGIDNEEATMLTSITVGKRFHNTITVYIIIVRIVISPVHQGA
eukprot:gene17420-19164_t